MTSETGPGVRARREILDRALERFAADGFAATSVQHIADDTGYSKSSVLYHFDSKERMLDAALSPALDALEALLVHLPAATNGTAQTGPLLESFVDFLLAYRREAAIVLIQGQSLAGLPVMARANLLITQLADGICEGRADLPGRMRVGVGLAGAAYVLATGDAFLSETHLQPDDDVRAALLGVLSELFFVER